MIRIKILDIDSGDDIIHYYVYADNGICSIGLEIYGYDDVFQKFANDLIKFPKSINEEIVFELGRKNPKYAFYLMIKAYCFSRNGQSALEIDAWKNGDEQTEYNANFTLKVEPASLNRFGTELKKWNPNNYEDFEWKEYS